MYYQPAPVQWQQNVHPSQISVQQAISEAQRTGGLWEDSTFPSNDNSIGKRTSNVHWKRPREFCQNPQLFIDGSSEGDVVQGDLGDCWFLGALAVVANRIDLIKEIIVSAHPEYGFYQFRFYKVGEWHVVIIDDRIPCRKQNNRWEPVFASCRDPNEIWVPLIEKAYAKLHGTYQKLDAGRLAEGFVDLTGGSQEVINFKDHSSGKLDYMGGLWGIITRCVQESWLLGVSSNKDLQKSLGLLTGHAYSILQAVHLPNTNIKLIKIRNPWGIGEWKGAYCDGSKEWTPWLEQYLNYKSDKNDGTFWMEFDDFVKYYTHIAICRLYSDSIGEKYYRYFFRGEWAGSSAGGSQQNKTWINNPQYGLNVTEQSNILISLTQEDTRMNSLTREYHSLSFFVFKSTDCTKRLSAWSNKNLLFKTGDGFYLPCREIILERNFEPGQYTIVPCTYDAGEKSKFAIIVYSKRPCVLHDLKHTGAIEVSYGNPMESLAEVAPAPMKYSGTQDSYYGSTLNNWQDPYQNQYYQQPNQPIGYSPPPFQQAPPYQQAPQYQHAPQYQQPPPYQDPYQSAPQFQPPPYQDPYQQSPYQNFPPYQPNFPAPHY